MSLFDLLSLFYAFLGARAVWTLSKNWRAFTDSELTAFDRQLASQIAFFVFVPIGVFLHELGHAAATYQVGGTIDWFGGGFHYALFYGYVIPQGRFTYLQDWWIALAGNLVSVIYGLVPLALLRFTNKAWIKYTIYSFVTIQLGWSLVGYPLITLTGIDSDWATIYGTSLLLTVPLFIAHAALVIALWLIYRSTRVKRWELNLHTGVAAELPQFDTAVTTRPGSPDPLITRANYFAAHGQAELAGADYRAALKIDPQNARALYNLAQLHMTQKRYSDAEKHFRAMLAHPETNPAIAAHAHYGLGMCLHYRGKMSEAIAEFDQAIARETGIAEFYFWRGLARRAAHDSLAANNDFARAVELATDNPALAARAREMMTTQLESK